MKPLTNIKAYKTLNGIPQNLARSNKAKESAKLSLPIANAKDKSNMNYAPNNALSLKPTVPKNKKKERKRKLSVKRKSSSMSRKNTRVNKLKTLSKK